MPNTDNNNLPLCMTIALGMLNACVGPQGWFAMWNGIKDISAYIADLFAGVATQIWQTTAALGAAFGDYLYDQLAVAKLLHVVTTTGTWLQATGIVVSGLLVSYAVLAFGYSVWTFGVCSNTVSQQVLSMHVVYVFLPLVLASIVFGLVGFDIEDQGAPIDEGHLGESPGNNIEKVDKNGKQLSHDGRVHKKNDKSISKPIASNEKRQGSSPKTANGAQGSSPKTANGGEVTYVLHTRQQSSIPSPTATNERKRDRLAETDGDTDSDNGRQEKLRKTQGGEVAWPHPTG